MDIQTPAPNPTPQVENVSPQNPVAEVPLSPKKPFLTGKIILLIILLILFGTGGTYLALNSKPKPQPTVSQAVPTPLPSITSVKKEKSINYSEVTIESCADLKTSSFTVKCPANWEIEYSSKGSTFITKAGGVADVVITADNGAIITLHKVCQGCFEVNVPAKEIEIFINGSKKKAYEVYSEDNNVKSWWLTGTDDTYFKFDVNKTPPPTENERKQIIDVLSTFKFLDVSPTPTCRPRPACLDAMPKCLIPETSDMCPKSVACTQEAKLCPDGKTYVGRQGPSCEFALCP